MSFPVPGFTWEDSTNGRPKTVFLLFQLQIPVCESKILTANRKHCFLPEASRTCLCGCQGLRVAPKVTPRFSGFSSVQGRSPPVSSQQPCPSRVNCAPKWLMPVRDTVWPQPRSSHLAPGEGARFPPPASRFLSAGGSDGTSLERGKSPKFLDLSREYEAFRRALKKY